MGLAELLLASIFILFCLRANANLQATCEIDGDRSMGPPGPVGKRGPVGAPGIQGTKGDPGDCNSWMEVVQRLEERVNQLENQLELRDWSVWSAWSDCVTERNCGSGERSRRRTCLFSPTGDSCVGSEIETGICSLPSCEAPLMLSNQISGAVFIYDDTDETNPWKGVCEGNQLTEPNKVKIMKTVCRQNNLTLAYVRDFPKKTFTNHVYFQPSDCNDDEQYLMQCQSDGWKLHANCEKQLQVLCTDVMHFRLPSNQITWTIVKRFCEGIGRQMCSFEDVFPYNDNVPIITGVLHGDYWVPIRGAGKDWVQIGNSPHRTGLKHVALGPASWGETITTNVFKEHFFCCQQL
ncbi:unnamed protein product [Clavelina lepadiformis]|uniref:SRCR domain-containing protein n=1 Tax=Clavelina lepadiformis TaxID=159417 RepID=A0ABP0GHC6_CLALP